MGEVNVVSVNDVRLLMEDMDNKRQQNNGLITIRVDEYMNLKKSYDEYQSKEYRIKLDISTTKYIEEGGKSKEISCITTSQICHPDDTATKLTELTTGLWENSQYIRHLSNEIDKYKDESQTRGKIIDNKDKTIEEKNTTIAMLMDEIEELQEMQLGMTPTPKKKKWFFFYLTLDFSRT